MRSGPPGVILPERDLGAVSQVAQSPGEGGVEHGAAEDRNRSTIASREASSTTSHTAELAGSRREPRLTANNSLTPRASRRASTALSSAPHPPAKGVRGRAARVSASHSVALRGVGSGQVPALLQGELGVQVAHHHHGVGQPVRVEGPQPLQRSQDLRGPVLVKVDAGDQDAHRTASLRSATAHPRARSAHPPRPTRLTAGQPSVSPASAARAHAAPALAHGLLARNSDQTGHRVRER